MGEAGATDGGTGGLTALVIEDHPMMRNAIVDRLQRGGIAVVAALGEGAGAVDAYSRHLPDIVLCDIRLAGDVNGVAVVKSLRARHADAKVVMLTAASDGPTIRAALAAGAIGYLDKQSTSDDEMFAAVTEAAAGEMVCDPKTAAKLAEALRKDKQSVSERELEVLQFMAAGLTNAEIARQLYLSPLTVKTHVTKIFLKLGVNDRAAAVAKAMRQGLVA